MNYISVSEFAKKWNLSQRTLIMFKECLANNIVPFIIDENLKMYYYRGLQEWTRIEDFLLDTCLRAQDKPLYFRKADV